ncbi:Yip1 family protein [Sporosarcina limicola]|uniref:Yip1 domain-containing protein n=1 Tax=Sporosarcina limicola TaxID=34101 RepID=A0A927RE95_9BACL|nr:Yip1 family protein [Sporosarcina limicola]MBE1556110.1 hypothetical protein [Sporosarcina limicola]
MNEKMNPWLSVWVKPRKTMRYVIETKSMQYMLIVVLISGVIDILDKASNKNLGDSFALPLIILMALVLGPLFGWIGWWTSSGISYWVGKWFGGQGSFDDLRMAFAVSYIPLVLLGVFWIFDILIVGAALFTEAPEVPYSQIVWLIIRSIISVIVGIWSTVILINTVAEAHRFSAWKAFATIILPVVVPVFFVFLLFMFI